MPEIELKPDQERVKNLLTDTVTLLCRNSLTFRDRLRIEGLLGVSIDNSDVFFVHISENFEQNSSEKAPAEDAEAAMFTAPESPAKPSRRPRESPCPSPSRQSQLSPASSPAQVKSEPAEDVDDLLIVEEPKPEVFADRARQASMVAGQRRAARRREHSPLVQHHQGGWDDMGEPAAKRHMSTDSESENNGGGQGSGFGQVDENVGWPDMVTDFNQGHMFQQDPGGSSFDTTTPGCSTWPTTLATQQQTQDTMTTTTKKLPATSSVPVRSALAEHLVTPLLRYNHRFLAFRLMWSSKQHHGSDDIWYNMPSFQQELCRQLSCIDGVQFMLSAITSTRTGKTRVVHPGLAFWVALDPDISPDLKVYQVMRGNAFSAELKLISNLNAQSEASRQINNVAMVVKDFGPGYVQSKMEACIDPNNEYLRERVYLRDTAEGTPYKEIILDAQKLLLECGLQLHVETY